MQEYQVHCYAVYVASIALASTMHTILFNCNINSKVIESFIVVTVINSKQ